MQQHQPMHAPPAAPPQPAPPPSLPAQPPALAPGTLLAGRYLIQGYIGGGGFGHIYKAHDKVLGHRRAIKEAFYRDVQTQRQFRLEAEFLLNARHPNLVRGYAVFEQSGRFYLVMDYVDGNTLEEIAIQHIRRSGRPLPEAQVLDWILPICDALQSLHNQPTPIIHRDVKPANVKLTRDGTPILIDLGLAKLYNAGTQTLGAALAFTPGYAPPEQYQASGATDQRTDVYGMGATLFYLLTGYQPTEAPARLGPHALPAPRALNPAISPQTEAIVLKAMTLDPRERQQSAGILLEELRQARASLAADADQQSGDSTGRMARVRGHMQPCLRCGTGNPDAARFCMRCGGPLSQGHPAGPPLARASDPPALVVPPASPASPALAPLAPAAAVIPAADAPAPAPALAAPGYSPRPALAGQPAQPAANRVAPQPHPPFTLTRSGLLRLARQADPRNLPAMLRTATAAAPDEALVMLAAILALVSVSLSLLAIFSGWLLIFCLPAMALGAWSLLHHRPSAPAEYRKLALAAIILGGGWLIVYLFIWLIFH